MFRLYRAELKKIFLKPSIFVVTGLIILLLTFSTFQYSPNTRDLNNAIDFPTSLNTVNKIYNEFSTGNAYYDKAKIDSTLLDAEKYIEFYEGENQTIITLQNKVELIKTSFEKYKQKYHEYQNEKDNNEVNDKLFNEMKSLGSNFKAALESYRTYFTDNVATKSLKVTVLATKDYANTVKNLVTKYIDKYDASTVLDDGDGAIINQVHNDNFYTNLKNLTSSLSSFNVDKEYATSLRSYITTAQERLETKYLVQIQEFATGPKASSDNETDKTIIKDLINDYYLTATNAYNVVINGIRINGLEKLGAVSINKYISFENTNLYELKESFVKTRFLFDNDNFAYNYADNFSIVQPSNSHINGFDFSYYALRLCTLFITIYIVVLAAGTIAGEQSAGTLKLLAIRPFSRSKLLSAKIFAILSIAAILLGVTSLASLVVGLCNWGLTGANILCVFNATTATVISPFIMYCFALFLMFIEVAFYAMLSVCISTVFKSNIGAVSVSSLLFFGSLILNIVAVNVPFLRFLPFTNISLFKYFGSAFVSNTNAMALVQGILTPTVFTGANFWISVVILIITFVFITYITYLLFKRRDLK